ncbi:MAG: twin-arginine translocase subunit TatC, partial [Halobaculum sp.]
EERAQQTDGDRGHASTVQPEAAFDARAGMEAGTGTEAEPTADAAPATPAAEAEPDTIPAAEAGTGTVGEGGTVGEPGTGVVEEGDDGLFGGDGPESDEEMPLTEHIEEMMRRLGAVFAVGGVVTLGVLVAGNLVPAVPNAEEIITFLWDAHVDFDNYRPYVYGPLELLLTKLKVAGLAGVVIALPVFVYQTYRFMRPGLYPHERRYYLAAVPTSLVLAVVGVAFAHFLVLPAIFQYFISYTEASANLAFGLRETFNLILLLMGYMAIVFQIPLFIQLSIMMGVVTREWLEQRRLLFWGSFLGLSFLVSPDPTGMSPIIVATTMVVLFEGTLALLRWTGN